VTTIASNEIPRAALSPSHSSSLKRLAIRGSAWIIGGHFASQVIRLGTNLILTRLLFPEAFGLVALAGAIYQGLWMFTDVGLAPSIIQSPRGEERSFYNTVWTIQVVRGAMLTIAACAIAWPMSWLYQQPQLATLIPPIALTAFISGWQSTSLYTASRRMAQSRVVMLDLITQIISVVIMVAWAVAYRNIWALVVGNVAASVAKAVLSWFLYPDIRNRFEWDSAAARSIVTFGGWIFVSTVITFFASQLDRLLLGHLVPLDVLGVYSVAFGMAMLPQQIVERVASGVFYPVFASVARNRRHDLEFTILKARQIILGAATTLILLMAFSLPLFFHTLYDARYADAGWMAQFLLLYAWFSVLMSSVSGSVLALGETRWLAASNLANAVITLIGCTTGYAVAGVAGFIVGLSLSGLAGQVVFQISLRRHGIHVVWQDLQFTAVILCLAAAGLGTHHVLTQHSLSSIGYLVPILSVVATGMWTLNRFEAQRRGRPLPGNEIPSLRSMRQQLPMPDDTAQIRAALDDVFHPQGGIGSISMLVPANSVEDDARKLLIRSASGRPAAVMIWSSMVDREMAARRAMLARQASQHLGPELGSVVPTILAGGRLEDRSFIVLPYYPDYSRSMWNAPLQSLRLWPKVLDWLRAATQVTRREPASDEVQHHFENPLAFIRDGQFSPRLRHAARDALDRLHTAKWRPQLVLAHNDLWRGNILATRPTFSGTQPFMIIDWAGSRVNGQAMYDLVRFSQSIKLSHARLRSEILSHCEIVSAESVDASSYLLASVGYLGMHLGYFPREHYLRVAECSFAAVCDALQQ
jgi:O-antigen/teichoic acid export membrane protein